MITKKEWCGMIKLNLIIMHPEMLTLDGGRWGIQEMVLYIHDLIKQYGCKFKYMLRKCNRDKKIVLTDKLTEQHNKSDK